MQFFWLDRLLVKHCMSLSLSLYQLFLILGKHFLPLLVSCIYSHLTSLLSEITVTKKHYLALSHQVTRSVQIHFQNENWGGRILTTISGPGDRQWEISLRGKPKLNQPLGIKLVNSCLTHNVLFSTDVLQCSDESFRTQRRGKWEFLWDYFSNQSNIWVSSHPLIDG